MAWQTWMNSSRRSARGKLALVAELGDRDAPHQFHHEVRAARFGRAGVEHLGDVRMVHESEGSILGDATAFATTSSTATNPNVEVRSFRSFTQAADENGDSRVMVGIHFPRSAVEAGQRMGREDWPDTFTRTSCGASIGPNNDRDRDDDDDRGGDRAGDRD